jgi:MinD superfamily P-loop ATPase
VKELVVCSGKGGTGKTSVVASFAALAEDPVLADCDVDAADLHLVLEPRILRRETFLSGHEAVIDPEICGGCGTCESLCVYGAARPAAGSRNGTRVIDPIGCEGCGVCVHFCPEQAIAFPVRTCGEWYVSETRHGPLVHARLGIGAENSGKLVTLVRKEARRLAEESASRWLLVDGPPGIGCPVIASLSGADGVLVVTEPTVSGLHDLARVIELARHFGVAVSVCLNKSDLSLEIAQRVEAYCVQQGIQLAGRIPYDPAVTAAQMAGRSIVENGASPAAGAIRDIWRRVRATLGD